MRLQRSILTALVAFGFFPVSYAQSTSDPCQNSTLLINSLETLQQAQKCRTSEGDILIHHGDDLPGDIELPLLEEVGGSILSLNFDENILSWRFAAPKLERVFSDFYFSHWVNLSIIDMPLFEQADRIRLNNLPQLTSAKFLSTIRNLENNYEVWNTSLTNLTNDRLEFAAFVEIFDNPRLERIELTALKNASYNIALRDNKPGLSVHLPNLTEVWYFEMQQISELEIPLLESAIGHFIVNMSSLDTISAPKLKTIGIWYDPHIVVTNNVGLVIKNNPQLETIDLPVLESIRLDLVVRNNSALTDVSLPSLVDVTGNIALEGSFEQVSFSQLGKVGGEFTIGSEGSSDFCGTFQALKNSGGIRKDFSCPAFEEPPVRTREDLERENIEEYIDEFLAWEGGEPQGDSGNGDNSGDQPGAGARIYYPGVEKILGLFFGIMFALH